MGKENLGPDPVPSAHTVDAAAEGYSSPRSTIGISGEQLQSAISMKSKGDYLQAAATNPMVGQSASVSGNTDDIGQGPLLSRKKSGPSI